MRDVLLDLATVGNAAAVKALLAEGADPNEANAYGHTPLINAAHNGHAEVVSLLLACHADPELKDLNGETALMAAAKNGHVEVVKALVEGGADINARDLYGLKAKHRARMAGKKEAARYLEARRREEKAAKFKSHISLSRLSSAVTNTIPVEHVTDGNAVTRIGHPADGSDSEGETGARGRPRVRRASTAERGDADDVVQTVSVTDMGTRDAWL